MGPNERQAYERRRRDLREKRDYLGGLTPYEGKELDELDALLGPQDHRNRIVGATPEGGTAP